MTNLPQSQNSGSISDFQISGQSLIKENCHKSRTSDNIENKEKENKVTSRKIDNKNCDVIVTFPIYGQFGAIQKPNSGRIVCKIYIFINSNTKTENKNKKSLTQLSHYCLQ